MTPPRKPAARAFLPPSLTNDTRLLQGRVAVLASYLEFADRAAYVDAMSEIVANEQACELVSEAAA